MVVYHNDGKMPTPLTLKLDKIVGNFYYISTVKTWVIHTRKEMKFDEVLYVWMFTFYSS